MQELGPILEILLKIYVEIVKLLQGAFLNAISLLQSQITKKVFHIFYTIACKAVIFCFKKIFQYPRSVQSHHKIL